MSSCGLTLQIGKSLYARAVLIDSGAFLSLLNPADTNHEAAVVCLRDISKYHLPLFVSLPTICETHRRALFDFGQVVAQGFTRNLYDGTVNIIRTIESDEVEAIGLMNKYSGLQLTLTDAINMAVMLRLGIAKAFSFDRHYLQVGFIRIPPFYL